MISRRILQNQKKSPSHHRRLVPKRAGVVCVLQTVGLYQGQRVFGVYQDHQVDGQHHKQHQYQIRIDTPEVQCTIFLLALLLPSPTPTAATDECAIYPGFFCMDLSDHDVFLTYFV